MTATGAAPADTAITVVELRQYTMLPGRRDDLIELFDREFVESQEVLGIRVYGTFRDLDRPDRFVWIRGFADMAARQDGLTSFYGGPVWREHRDAANATMDDVSDVLLLRPVRGFPPLPARPPATHTQAPGSQVTATIHYASRAYSEMELADLDQRVGPAAVATFTTEYADNNFPALPVRTGEHAYVWLARGTAPVIEPPTVVSRTEVLRLSPTARSLLR
jgi:quinol monooxygenase YgiN